MYAVLEGHVDLIVGNAHHIKNVPGRKTDVKDAEWIAQLVRHGDAVWIPLGEKHWQRAAPPTGTARQAVQENLDAACTWSGWSLYPMTSKPLCRWRSGSG